MLLVVVALPACFGRGPCQEVTVALPTIMAKGTGPEIDDELTITAKVTYEGKPVRALYIEFLLLEQKDDESSLSQYGDATNAQGEAVWELGRRVRLHEYERDRVTKARYLRAKTPGTFGSSTPDGPTNPCIKDAVVPFSYSP